MIRWRATAAMVALTAVTAVAGIEITDGMRLKGADGTVYGVVVDCPQPGAKQTKGKYFGGSEDSKIGKDRCGKCLVDANWGTHLKHPYDLHIKGTLLDEKDQPVKNQMVQFFLANGWTVKTRTAPTGYFRIIMGATQERKSSRMVELDLGKRYMKKGGDLPYYAFYLLPDSFKPCKDDGAK